MSGFTWSFIEVNVLIVLLFLSYLGVKNNLRLKHRRLLLMSIPLVSIIIIWVKKSLAFGVYAYSLQIIELSPVTINSGVTLKGITTEGFNFSVVYGTVALLLIPVLFYRIYKVIIFFKRNKAVKSGHYKIYEVPGKDSFSFFNHIQIKSDLSGEDRQIVLEHEKIHANHWHSLDILVMEIYHLIFWLNPIFFWIKRELVNLHEFQVDAIMYKTYRVNYLKFLINYALGFSTYNYLLTSRFYNRLTIKKRIQSMKTGKKNKWWMAMVLPILGCAAIFVQCTKTAPDSITEESANAITTEIMEPEKIYDSVDEEPTFKGDESAMIDFIVENVNYPKEAKKEGVEGMVFVQFIIDSKGQVKSPKVLRGVDERLDAEALRVVTIMPDWNPAIKDGKPVSVRFTLPINFLLS